MGEKGDVIPHAGLANSQPPPSGGSVPSLHLCLGLVLPSVAVQASLLLPPRPSQGVLPLLPILGIQTSAWLPPGWTLREGCFTQQNSLWISRRYGVGMSGHLCPGGAVTPYEDLTGHPALPALPPAFQPGRCLGWSPHLSELCPCGLGAGARVAAAGSRANEVV